MTLTREVRCKITVDGSAYDNMRGKKIIIIKENCRQGEYAASFLAPEKSKTTHRQACIYILYIFAYRRSADPIKKLPLLVASKSLTLSCHVFFVPIKGKYIPISHILLLLLLLFFFSIHLFFFFILRFTPVIYRLYFPMNKIDGNQYSILFQIKLTVLISENNGYLYLLKVCK